MPSACMRRIWLRKARTSVCPLAAIGHAIAKPRAMMSSRRRQSVEITPRGVVRSSFLHLRARGSFYEATGALRDMVPNHLFTLLSMVTMEPPVGFGAGAIVQRRRNCWPPFPRSNRRRRYVASTAAASSWVRKQKPIGKNPTLRQIRMSRPTSRCGSRSTIGAGRVCRSICGPANICRSGTLRSPSASSRPPTRPSKIRLWTLCVRIGYCCASLRTKESLCNSRSSAAAP
jgi:Glucose-6-phosphate dehydrogenase, C-terminal domain